MPEKSKYFILNQIITADVIESWQKTIDLMAEIMNVPAGLVMQVHRNTIEVLVKSKNKENIYEAGERANLNTGLYCETVMDTKDTLVVPDALADLDWKNNPDVSLGMISYMGMPITWPEGEIFGTICVLDSKYNKYTTQQRLLLEQFKIALESSLSIIYSQQKLNQELLLRQEKEKELFLQSKIIALSEMITNIAHQWRQPLNTMTTIASNIKVNIELEENMSNEDMINFSDSIISESQYLSGIIEDFNTIFYNDIKSIESISLKELFSKVEKNTAIEYQENGVKYICDIEDDVSIYGNESILIKVFSSIYNNALEAILSNEIPKNERFFFLNLKKQNNSMIISLCDSGGGLDEDNISKVFEPYYSTKFKARGKGLSLYIVYLIITNHLRGTIKIQNSQYFYKNKALKGAVIVIELPLSQFELSL